MKTSRGPGRVSLPRAISKLGFASRSQAMVLIQQGAVSVNAEIERNPHRWIDLQRDRIRIDDRDVGRRASRYLLLHKPKGFVTSRSDERGARTVFDLLAEDGNGLSPVGRLDKDTTGLLLFTNDHRLGDRLTNPHANLEKTYLVNLDRSLTRQEIEQLSRGVEIRIDGSDTRTKPARVKQRHDATFEISITEGKNRQIHRMLAVLGHEVISLKRISIGSLVIGDLPEGKWRELTPDEVDDLKRVTGLAAGQEARTRNHRQFIKGKPRGGHRKSYR